LRALPLCGCAATTPAAARFQINASARYNSAEASITARAFAPSAAARQTSTNARLIACGVKSTASIGCIDGAKGGPGQSYGSGGTPPLPAQAAQWPTPAAQNWKGIHRGTAMFPSYHMCDPSPAFPQIPAVQPSSQIAIQSSSFRAMRSWPSRRPHRRTHALEL
jgi:hypothetical protein